VTGRRHLLAGAGWGLAAEGLAAPSGLITVAFLTRMLGPEGYGQYALAVGVVVFLDGIWAAASSRAVIRHVGQAKDPALVLPFILRVHVAVGLALGALVFLTSGVISGVLGEPSLQPYLRVFALDLPLAAIGEAHVNSLLGLGRYRFRALARAVRWTVRPLAIIALVAAGYGIPGALVGGIVATSCEIAVARVAVRPRLWGASTLTLPTFAATTVPLLAATTITSLLRRVDLFFLTALGGTAVAAGHYAAAQNVALVPALVSLAVSPVLVAAVNRALRDGSADKAQHIARDALRLCVLLLPVFATLSGAAGEVAVLLYGEAFAPAGPIVAVLVPASVLLSLSAVQASLLVALDRPRLTLALTIPALAVALTGYVLLAPRFGAIGVAWGTFLGALCGVACGAALSRRHALLRVPLASATRAVVVAAAVYVCAVAWPTPGSYVVLKLAALAAAVPAALALLGELDLGERASLAALVRGRDRAMGV